MALVFANNSSLANITELPSGISGGALNLISTQTASASASLEFSMDSTYDSYVFKFINIHPATDGANFEFNMSTDGGSNYNVVKTTTIFLARHFESDANIEFTYDGGSDLAQGTGFQLLIGGSSVGADNDQHISGSLTLYNPSSTTFVKHFIATTHTYGQNDASYSLFSAGYGNTTSAINGVKFIMHSGNIDDGIIKMYGVK